jgi:hypothetical protein
LAIALAITASSAGGSPATCSVTRGGGALQMSHHHRRRPVGGEKRRLTRQQAKQRAAQRIQVRPGIEPAPGEHLGDGIGHRGYQRPGRRQTGIIKGAGDPEITQPKANSKARAR